MKNKFNDQTVKNRRRYLRNNMTIAEIKLWSRLKGKQILNYKFRRQYSIDNYIVDFYSPKLRLAIEVDGGQHNAINHRRYDEERTEMINNHNIIVLRYWNHDVLGHIEDVLDDIIYNIKNIR